MKERRRSETENYNRYPHVMDYRSHNNNLRFYISDCSQSGLLFRLTDLAEVYVTKINSFFVELLFEIN